MLLERDEPLALLRGALAGAAEGRGRSVFIGGEAGIGKTSLVEAFAEAHHGSARVLWGACEALATPRPLGPLYDIAEALRGELLDALRASRPPHELFQAFLHGLCEPGRPTLVVIEDAHWADDASADFLKFVARRIARHPALFAVTYREEEVSPRHPMMRAIAELPADHLTRIRLQGLSPGAVERLATVHGRTIPNLHAITEGNPLLVTELLRNHEAGLPATLRDTVLARLERLPPEARELAEFVAVVPDRTERRLLDRGFATAGQGLQACIDQRLLMIDRETVRYRHEVARRVVEDALPELRRRALNAQVLAVLADGPTDAKALPRLVHHAAAAGDASSVLRHAPSAAAEAAKRGAHRQAAAFYRAAVQHADRIEPRARAALLEKLAAEAGWSGARDEALSANDHAYAIWESEGDTFAQGRNRQARYDLVRAGLYAKGGHEYGPTIELAVELLEPHGPSTDLAMAYVNLAFSRSTEHRDEEAQQYHDRAVAMAEALADPFTLSYVLLYGEWRKNSFYGQASLEPAKRAVNLALDHGDDRHVAQAQFCLALFASNSWQVAEAEPAIAAGLRFAEQRDLDLHWLMLSGLRVRMHFLTGRWTAMAALADVLLARADLPAIAEWHASIYRALVLARQGDPRAGEFMQRTLDVSRNKIGTRLNEIGTLMGLAEMHWHFGDRVAALASARRGHDEAISRSGHPWARGLSAFWLRMSDGLDAVLEGLPPPYAMHLSGDWAGAATAWEEMSLPFERAMALVTGDEAARREGFAILDRLGATATVRRCREILSERGVRHLPRGPRPATRGNPAGLTQREIEILRLLEQGLANAEISTRLHRSVKTVGNHVSAILAKLGAETRREAVHIARGKGLFGPRS
jgi:DNA-binding CsgD family transcriptional regulator